MSDPNRPKSEELSDDDLSKVAGGYEQKTYYEKKETKGTITDTSDTDLTRDPSKTDPLSTK